MSKAGIVFVSSFIAIAALFLIMALGFPGEDRANTPGPGYFPIIISVVIIFISLILGFFYLRDKEKYFNKNETEKKNLPIMLITSGAIIVYIIALMFIPFIPLTILFILFLNRLYKRPWKFNIIFSVIFTLSVYFVFSRLLHVML